MSVEEANVYQRCEPDDPNCCQGLNKFGQCNLRAIEGQKYCRLHFGFGHKKAENDAARNYRLNRYQNRVNEFADNTQVKSLREEIGVLRMLLEETVNKCQNDTDLLIYSTKISDLVVKIQKLVESCHKLELSSGELLDKSTIMYLGDVIINIVGEVCPPDKIQEVANRIMDSVANINTLQQVGNAELAAPIS